MATWTSDLRLALRGWRRSPGYTASALLVLAVGLGGLTAVFAVVDAVLLRPLPYPDPERLTFVWSDLPASDYRRAPLSGPELDDLRRASALHEGFAAIWASEATLVDEDQPQAATVGMVTADFLRVLGVEPIHGRWFEAVDGGEGAPARLVLGGTLWRTHFGGDPDVVGRVVQVDGGWGVPGGRFTVVGVMPPDFELRLPTDASVPSRIDLWMPFQHDLAASRRNLWYLRTIGRLAPGAQLAAAQQEIASIGDAMSAAHPEYAATGRALYAVGLHDDAVHRVRPALLALLGAMSAIVLLVCANLAGLQLARAAGRTRELAVRRALGASGYHLARRILLEGLLLVVGGAALGLALAMGLLRTLRQLGLDDVPGLAAAGLDARAWIFAASIAAIAGLLLSSIPIWVVGRMGRSALRGSAGTNVARAGSDRGTMRWHGALVITQVATAVVLVVGAGLLTASFRSLLEVDAGFSDADVETFRLSLPAERYPGIEDLARFATRLEERLVALPGVDAAGVVNQLPMSDQPNWSTRWRVRADPLDDVSGREADARAISPGYLRAVDAKLVAGRLFEPRDDSRARRVVLVDEMLAHQAWPDEPAVGREIEVSVWAGTEQGFVATWAEVVGVVRHVRHHDLGQAVRGQVFVPFAQGPRNQLGVAIAVGSDAPTSGAKNTLSSFEAVRSAVQGAVHEIDPALALAAPRPLAAYVERSRSGPRLRALLTVALGAIALVLAVLGLYGLVALGVARRIPEIGVRMSLGATARDILGHVWARGAALFATGAVAGLFVAWALRGLVEGLLFGVEAGEPSIWLASLGMLAVTALAAAYVPARRASRVDPVRSLRGE